MRLFFRAKANKSQIFIMLRFLYKKIGLTIFLIFACLLNIKSQKLDLSFYQGFYLADREFTEFTPLPTFGVFIPREDNDYKYFISGLGLKKQILKHFDIEFQTIYHYSSIKKVNDNLEFVLVFIFRIHPFNFSSNGKPSKLNNISLAFGEGISQYINTPHPLELNDGLHISGFNNYLTYEIEYQFSDRMKVLLKVHHRSTVNKIFGTGNGGTDFATFGIRRVLKKKEN